MVPGGKGGKMLTTKIEGEGCRGVVTLGREGFLLSSGLIYPNRDLTSKTLIEISGVQGLRKYVNTGLRKKMLGTGTPALS